MTFLILSKIERPSSTAATITEKSSDNKTRSATSLATSVPEPRATPIFACFKAGASFIPSPVMATISPFLCQAKTILDLCFGSTLAYIFIFSKIWSNSSSDSLSNSLPSKIFSSSAFRPNLFATALAVNLLSPVIIIGFIPASKQIRKASLALSLTGSSK